ncbi:unnamed protein product [Somion occarium]|uniref:Uncharacterized protein n=1 Tax=Somion occarium TaxID=3059160 RepID=A0ABP1DJ07_9APHY
MKAGVVQVVAHKARHLGSPQWTDAPHSSSCQNMAFHPTTTSVTFWLYLRVDVALYRAGNEMAITGSRAGSKNASSQTLNRPSTIHFSFLHFLDRTAKREKPRRTEL